MTRPGAVIVVLVALRLVTGWHFFNEGVKKLDPDFSSAGFLRQAKGPLGPTFRGMVTGPYNAREHLGTPLEVGSDGVVEAVDESVTDWLAEIEASWADGLVRVGRLGASDEELEQSRDLKRQTLSDLEVYLRGEREAMTELRLEAWRLAEMHASGDKNPPPFLRDRIADKQNEVWYGMQPWFSAASQAQQRFAEGVVAIVGEDGPSEGRVRSALAERSRLSVIDTIVMAVVLGCGVLLFLGLFTPLAAVVAAGFLISVMATQPPWAAGANTDYFFYQLVEVAALATLAVVGAGRWAGLDRLVFDSPARGVEAEEAPRLAA